ncbi:hypothetical protein HERIO_843 [Hepatospora eriocheir]|uniref:Uncharacterized protein n=1 Tax=Hepatospora eriocheir TaxID=1081669 RepID=A0A1X0QBY1_9MICR|nr:hypothetical protein HERIO_843 [Hepatospora eriocheir]
MRQRNKSYSGKSVNKSPKSKKLSNKNLNDSSNDILYLKDEPILDKDSSFLIEESTTEIPKPEDLVNKSIKTEDETSEKNEVKGARKLTIFLEFGSLNLEVDKSVTDKQMKYIIDQIMGIKVLGDYVEDIEPTTSGSINKNLLKKIKSKSFIDRQHKNLDSPNADLVNFIVSAEMEESVEDVTDVKPLSEISRKLSSKNNSINETDESKMKESQLSNLSSKKSLIDSKMLLVSQHFSMKEV